MQSVQPKLTDMTGAKPLVRKKVVTQKRKDDEILKTVEPMKFRPPVGGFSTFCFGDYTSLDNFTESIKAKDLKKQQCFAYYLQKKI